MPLQPSNFWSLNDTNNISDIVDNTTTYNTGLMINQNNVAEGPTIPPIQSGQFRVPRPNGFQILNSTPDTPTGTVFTFTWEDIDVPICEIAGYRIFATFAYDANQQPTQIGSSSMSPCAARLIANSATSVVFTLQPYLLNGLTLPLDQCPTCTTTVPAPAFVLNLSDNGPQPSLLITMDSTHAFAGTSSNLAGFTVSSTHGAVSITSFGTTYKYSTGAIMGVISTATGNATFTDTTGAIEINLGVSGSAKILMSNNQATPSPTNPTVQLVALQDNTGGRVATGRYLQVLLDIGAGPATYYIPLWQ